MSQYLDEAPYEEAMSVFYGGAETPPIKGHTIWTGDFMGMGKHDIPCPVCFDAPAMIERNVTPGQWRQEMQPCSACQREGWRVRRRSRMTRLRIERWVATLMVATAFAMAWGEIGL